MMRIKQNPGFAMIEAVVAMAVLAMVSVGVLTGLDAAQRSSGREKARSVAAALTEQDQERLRSFRAVDLANYDETRNVTVNNVSYSINSTADWVRDSTGGTQSCSNNATQADYMRVTSITTSNLINSPIPAIKMSSLVAPPIGAFGADEGTLGIQVTDRAGVGVAGTNVTITGPTSLTNATNSAGCAIFAYVPVGTYTAGVNQVGWVNHGGITAATVGATVSAGTVNVKTIDYDKASSVQVTFDTEPLTGTATTSVAATTTQFAASNAGVPAGAPVFAGIRTYDPTGGAVATIAGTNLFPFADGYGLYGGGCPGADPTKYITDYYDQFPAAFIDTDPGVAAAPVKLRLPSINLKVLYGVLPSTKPVTIVVTSTSTNCSEKFTFPAPATDAAGFMVTPALPFGDYKVCASALKPTGTTINQVTITNVQNRYQRGIKPQPGALTLVSPVIDLSNPTSTGTCT